MGFAEFLQERELAEQAKAERESGESAWEAHLRNRAPVIWKDLQEAVRNMAAGKVYRGEHFVWRALPGHAPSLVLKNVAASFVDHHRDSHTFTVMLAGIPGVHALWASTSPDPEFIDVRFMGGDRWLVGASMQQMKTAGENSAAEAICKALVTYFDDQQRARSKLVS